MNNVFNKYYNDLENNNISFQDANQIQYDAMGDDTIRKYYPDAKIITYNELNRCKSIEELLPHNNSFVYILYQSSPNFGHWTLLSKSLVNNNPLHRNKQLYRIEFFDSYGGEIDQPLNWSKDDNHLLGQGKKYLSILLDEANKKNSMNKYDIVYNSYDFQNENNGNIATCGRWCVLRNMTIKNNNMKLEEFIKMMKFLKSKSNQSYDIIVSDLINRT